jgi:beta-N-acetylhexosaminidase
LSGAEWAETAAIFGCAGPVLAPEEAAFFRHTAPVGFILFARNIESPAQVRALTAALRETVGGAPAPILVDQEGGRVARLGPPHWRHPPPARVFGDLHARDAVAGQEACRLNARLIAHDLSGLGIDVDCAPVLDLPAPGSHDIVGDRAFAADAASVAALGRAMAEGLVAGGVAPVAKHIPGHGRATADSHHELPVVAASRAALEADFAPFRALADLPWAMTAHIRYLALDADRPATLSRSIVDGIVRRAIGFSGVLVTDDLSMKALGGTYAERARAALAAGCDVVLHCNGRRDEMADVAAGAAGGISAEARRRLARARPRGAAGTPFDPQAAAARLASLLGPVA